MAEWEPPLWEVFFALEPWGPAQDDLRSGVIWSLLWNVNRSATTPSARAENIFPSLVTLRPKYSGQTPAAMARELKRSLGVG